MMTNECEHGLEVNGGADDTCLECDWCYRCDQVVRWNGEVCTVCGRIWGED